MYNKPDKFFFSFRSQIGDDRGFIFGVLQQLGREHVFLIKTVSFDGRAQPKLLA